MKLCPGRFKLDFRKIIGWLGTGTAHQGSGDSTNPGRAQKVFGQCSQEHSGTLGVSYVGPEVGL